MIQNLFFRWVCLSLLFCLGGGLNAQPASNGLTGYINNPSAYMSPDGTWRLGFSYAQPFSALYSSIQILPWAEATGRFTQINGVPGFAPGPNINYGSYKDKSVAFKVTVASEGSFSLPWWPEVAFGVEDRGFGTDLFAKTYAIASQRLNVAGGQAEISLGYGQQGIQGKFGGVRYRHRDWPQWAWVAEYDRSDYSKLPGAATIGLNQRRIGRVNAAVEYTWLDGVTLQAGTRDGQIGLNASVSIPFEKRELIPKTNEPEPYQTGQARPVAKDWKSDERHWQQMVRLLHEDGARHVRMSYDAQIMQVSLEGTRQLFFSRTVGRAARIILAHSPAETEKIEITLTQNGLALATFTFGDIITLQRYFNGVATRQELEGVMGIRYANPSDVQFRSDMDAALESFTSTLASGSRATLMDGSFLRMSYEMHDRSGWAVGPYMGTFFNDPSGALKLDVGMAAGLTYALGKSTFFETQAAVSLIENVSGVSQPSNSRLPHVRTDVAEYNRASKLRLEKMLINHYFQPQERVFGRASAGLYERMFGGFGGQLLYVPRGALWAVDASLDTLVQRDYKGTGFLGYRTVTALLSGHYKLPYNLTATARVGQFLAKDRGVRMEMKREFASGVQVGAWYTVTNGNDTTNPGAPANPYHDKGVFMSIPFDLMLTRNTATVRRLAFSPWTRDVGQMVESPGDLHAQVERGFFRYMHEPNRLRGFGDMPREDRP